ncbi:MAG: hypothetical protein PVH17_05745 [Anaerolineae bacterium]|jgi:hypothetical protein
MTRGEALWLAFEKFAIFFSFTVAFILVMVLLVTAFVTWQMWPTLQALRSDVACPMVADVNSLVDDFDNAVITQTIHINQTIPVRFELPLDESLNVQLTQGVKLNRPTTFTLPAGGGQINGRVTLVLPKGQNLPVHMSILVPVDQQLPVEMDVPVTIPLKETELGSVTGRLKDLLTPYMDLLDKTLACSTP